MVYQAPDQIVQRTGSVLQLKPTYYPNMILSVLLDSRKKKILVAFIIWYILRKLYHSLIQRKKNIEDRLRNKVVLITGAGSGLGQLFVTKLAEHQAIRKFILWDVDQKGLDATVKILKETDPGVKIEAEIVNVGNRNVVFKAAEKHLKTTEDVPDILILNAGIVRGNGYVEEKNEADVRAVMDVNYFHLFWCTQAFLVAMEKKPTWTRIVTLCSSAGLSGNPRLADYCASKAAAVGFSESLSYELIKKNSSCSCAQIDPYLIDTGMFKGTSGFNVLLPLLKPEYVVKHSIEHCILGDCLMLLIPDFVYVAGPLKALPIPIRSMASRLLGAFDTMDNFVGRSPT